MELARTEELLRSLSPLSNSDVVEIPLMSAKINEEVKRYETEICQLESRIMYLRSKQEFLQRRREKLDSLPAPVRRLPTELLSLIFISLCDDDGIVFGYRRLLPLPFILASVCHRWREVAIATPHIWSRIRLDDSLDDEDADCCAFLAPLQMALERSNEFPLSIHVESRFIDEETSPLLDLLATQSHRWVDVKFSRLLESALQNVAFSTPLSALKRLTVLDDIDDIP